MLRTGDQLQLAIDNSQSPTMVAACMTGPTDDFSASATLRRDCGDLDGWSVQPGLKERRTVVYRSSQPGGFLVAQAWDSDPPVGTYAITVERVIRRINVGLALPATVKRSSTLRAVLRYGDNTPVLEPMATTLWWRRGARTSSGPRSFTPLVRGLSSEGVARLRARFPAEAGPKLQLRACVDQPGAARICTKPAVVWAAWLRPSRR